MTGKYLSGFGFILSPDQWRVKHSVMTYHKEGPACGKIPCDPTSSEADCEYPLDEEKKGMST